jgi:segregation and condensation protein B
VLKTLLERRLIRIAGRKEVVGKPFLYASTREFLLHFGLRSLKELPPLEQFEEMFGAENGSAEPPADTEEVADREAEEIRDGDEAAMEEARQQQEEWEREEEEARQVAQEAGDENSPAAQDVVSEDGPVDPVFDPDPAPDPAPDPDPDPVVEPDPDLDPEVNP